MEENIGTTEQLIRIMIGLLFLDLGIHFGSYWGLLGLYPLVTGLVRVCPAIEIIKQLIYLKKT